MLLFMFILWFFQLMSGGLILRRLHQPKRCLQTGDGKGAPKWAVYAKTSDKYRRSRTRANCYVERWRVVAMTEWRPTVLKRVTVARGAGL